MDAVYDPLRRKQVAATPEEMVRQWFIGLLRDGGGCPAQLMMSETGFRFGGKRYRADILVYDRGANPLAVVECKRPDVTLDADVARQALRYDMVLSVKWIMLTNGNTTFVYHRETDRFVPFGHVPSYEEMLCRQ